MSLRCFLDKKSDYVRVLRGRQKVAHNGWRLHYVRHAPAPIPRFAVVIAKQHVRTAVQRNRMRRVLREYFRQELMLSLPPMDYLMQSIAPMPLPQTSSRLREDCRRLFADALKKPL